jgi:hypothetical protein
MYDARTHIHQIPDILLCLFQNIQHSAGHEINNLQPHILSKSNTCAGENESSNKLQKDKQFAHTTGIPLVFFQGNRCEFVRSSRREFPTNQQPHLTCASALRPSACCPLLYASPSVSIQTGTLAAITTLKHATDNRFSPVWGI